MQTNETPKLAYTIAETCHASSLSRSKIYELISEGRLAARKIGSRTIIPADSLQKLISGEGAGK